MGNLLRIELKEFAVPGQPRRPARPRPKARNRGINPMQSKFAESVSSAISDFSQSFSLRASILKSAAAAQSLPLCRGHV